MSDPSRRDLLRLSFATLLSPLVRPHVAAARQAAAPEMRGLWVTRSWMTSPAEVAQMVDDASRHGFTAVFAQVRGRGDAFYQGGPDPRASLLARQPASFDPLADLIERAHARGLQVHAWFNTNLVAGATALPTAPQHVAVQHPEWLMVPRDLAPALLRRSPRDRRYVSTLATWTRRHAATVEGLFSSPIPDGAQARLDATITHLTSRYALDGLHLDYIRFPSPDFDVSRAALDAFRQTMALELTPSELAALDARSKADPLALVDLYPARWTAFRRDRVTQLVTRLGTAARKQRPDILLTTAVWPDPDHARNHKLQDWSRWLREGVIDAVCPMMYTNRGAEFDRQLQRLTEQPAGGVWPGIGAYRIDAPEAVRRVERARALGFGGVLLYSYDSMTGGTGKPSAYMATLRRRVFDDSGVGQTDAAR